MTRKILTILSCISLASAGSLQAQDSGQEESADNPTRTLRIIVVGKRPMPAFKQVGDKVIEVDPPLSLLPPTSFSFADQSHAPRSKPGIARKTKYSAWSNQLIRIQNYKGPAILPLKLSRPLIESAGAGQQVNCNLGKVINPLILLHADSGSSGWETPHARVIDMSPEKVPERSVTVVNFTQESIRIYLTKEGIIISPNKHTTLRLPSTSTESFRYLLEASNGKKVKAVSNSSYRTKKGSRVIMLVLPGTEVKKGSFPSPKLKIITDSV